LEFSSPRASKKPVKWQAGFQTSSKEKIGPTRERREKEKERERLSHWSLALDFVRLCDYHFSPFGQINDLTKMTTY
jgi:hypothetical protein